MNHRGAYFGWTAMWPSDASHGVFIQALRGSAFYMDTVLHSTISEWRGPGRLTSAKGLAATSVPDSLRRPGP
ncbi:Uncharacterised protein [Mycobacteroides abscessus subsp. abscessus]|jgi:hypothetical protein|nr:Uncharacterised protein [Mycobacteroides abscessus subsp. abscessus]SKQ54733.1 Uncharacterised protein [Mycobacteroides abscessus subsp. abscessus]SKX24286.1 Uncharacterised protein [Mycobacteroides abscessus subsp. abscessus]